jgi:hypothetical protein
MRETYLAIAEETSEATRALNAFDAEPPKKTGHLRGFVKLLLSCRGDRLAIEMARKRSGPATARYPL